MPFDPRQAGFAWPEEITLTNANEETMTIRPYAANLSAVQHAGHQRIGQCYRYYTSTSGIMTELDVFYWYAGGPQVCSEFLSAFKTYFDNESATRIPSTVVVEYLAQQGFDETTILVNLRWLIHGGYISLENADEGQFLSIENW